MATVTTFTCDFSTEVAQHEADVRFGLKANGGVRDVDACFAHAAAVLLDVWRSGATTLEVNRLNKKPVPTTDSLSGRSPTVVCPDPTCRMKTRNLASHNYRHHPDRGAQDRTAKTA